MNTRLPLGRQSSETILISFDTERFAVLHSRSTLTLHLQVALKENFEIENAVKSYSNMGVFTPTAKMKFGT